MTDLKHELAGRRALITGASRGIGAATARLLAQRGVRVAVNARSAAAAESVAAAIRDDGGEALAIPADVGDSAQVSSLFAQLKESWGGVDILVNNAGITHDGFLMMMREDAWDEVLAVNLRGAYLCARQALRAMIAGRWGRIVNVVSPAALVGKDGASNYAAAKGGLLAMGKSLAGEVGRYQITVNAVCPGFIDTELIAGMPPAERERFVQQIPLGRFGDAQEVAEAIAFLVSPRATYITGATLTVDGGLLKI